MSARALTVVPDDVVMCMLCGSVAATYLDLCDTCARAFAELADRVAGRLAVAIAAADPDAVAGQLDLTDVEDDVEPRAFAKHERVTLARIVVGDQLMTETAPGGLVVPFRWSNGTVRTVAEITKRPGDPAQHEMPGQLYVLTFTDGTSTEPRYGTTGHYRVGQS